MRMPYIKDSLQILRMRKSIHYLSLRLMKYLLIIKLDSLLQIKQSTMNLLVQIEIQITNLLNNMLHLQSRETITNQTMIMSLFQTEEMLILTIKINTILLIINQIQMLINSNNNWPDKLQVLSIIMNLLLYKITLSTNLFQILTELFLYHQIKIMPITTISITNLLIKRIIMQEILITLTIISNHITSIYQEKTPHKINLRLIFNPFSQ